VERITVAMFIKFMLIKTEANKRLGVFNSKSILLSVLLPEVFSSSISVGEREKKADSVADTIATIISNNTIESNANKILVEIGFTIIVMSGEQNSTKCKLLVKDKML